MVRIEHPLYREDLSNTAALIERSGLSGKILIIGATGLIGSFLTDSLIFFNRSIRKQFEIYAMGRSLLRLQKRFSYALSDEIFFGSMTLTSLWIQKLSSTIFFNLPVMRTREHMRHIR